MKYQSVVTPDGIIVHMFGPIVGSRHDCTLLKQSNLMATLNQHIVHPEQSFVLYGDPAYSSNDVTRIKAPFKGSHLTTEKENFNKRMSSVRQSVEWEFGRLVRLWASVDFVKQQKVYLQNVGKMYLVAAMLTNIHGCLYPSQTAQYFGINPPSVEEYLNTFIFE